MFGLRAKAYSYFRDGDTKDKKQNEHERVPDKENLN